MSKVAQFSPYQFIDAGSLTSLANYASAALNHFASGTFFPGLIDPTGITFTVSGFSISAVLNPPFQILFQNGASSYAHGTVNGVDTQTYTLNVSSFVPTSGMPNTVYIVASYTTILQNQDAIIGPPPGHPDFNPNFNPYLAYSVLVDSMAVTATLTQPDNINFFELVRTTLASGVSGIGLLTTAYQQQAQQTRSIQVTPTSGVTIAPTQNGVMIDFTAIGIYTLPPVSQVNTQLYTLTTLVTGIGNRIIIQASTSDPFGPNFIYGTWPTAQRGFPAIILDPGTAVDLLAANGYWQVKSGNPRSTMFRSLLTTNLQVYVANPPLGNDSNSGLSASSPLATIQAATNLITQNYDAGAFSAGVQIASGNYAGANVSPNGFNGLITFTGAGSGATIIGQDVQQDGNCFVFNGPLSVSLNYMTIQGSTDNQGCVNVGQGVNLTTTSGLAFGNSIGNHINIGPGGYANLANKNYVVAGSGSSHFNIGGGGVCNETGVTITLVGTPFFSNTFATVYSCGVLTIPSATFNGSASGGRASITSNGVINTAGQSVSYLPGSSPLTSGSGGQYV